MKLISDEKVADVFNSYPEIMREKLLFLRQLIINTASETEGINELEETLKWGEPSYLTKNGSTIRIAWRSSEPSYYGIYFNCKTSLLETFKEIYGNVFNYDGSRAIVFEGSSTIPIEQLKQCIVLSLTYHSKKHLPLLGM
ncbi:MAG: DUF1801 domain-containing protein [Methylophagaceae bacterium]